MSDGLRRLHQFAVALMQGFLLAVRGQPLPIDRAGGDAITQSIQRDLERQPPEKTVRTIKIEGGKNEAGKPEGRIPAAARRGKAIEVTGE